MESLELGVDAGYFSITNKLATIDYRTCSCVSTVKLYWIFFCLSVVFSTTDAIRKADADADERRANTPVTGVLYIYYW